MDVVTTGDEKRVLRWERPKLPERYRGSGLAGGVMLLLGATLLAAMPFLYAEAAGYNGFSIMGMMVFWWPLAGALLMLGMWVISVTLILREIRLQAFEAAIRSGDLKDVTAPKRAAAEA